MTPLAQALSAALIHFVWQGSIIGLLLWLTMFLLKKRSANVRYAVSCTALTILVTLPLLTTVVLYQKTIPFAVGTRAVAGISQIMMAPRTGAGPRQMNWLAHLQIWALPIWSLGVLLFSIRLLWCYTHAFTLGRRGDPAEESVIAMVAS